MDDITIPTWVLRDKDIVRLIKTAENTLAESRFDTEDITDLIRMLVDLFCERNYSSVSGLSEYAAALDKAYPRNPNADAA